MDRMNGERLGREEKKDAKASEYLAWAEDVRGRILRKMEWVRERNKEKLPYTTDENGDYDDRSDTARQWNEDDGLNWWTNGFWPGIMWLLYEDTKDEAYARTARYGEYLMERCLTDYYGLHHDVGFMFQPSAVADYRITGNERSRRTALHAASLLAGRFNPAGDYIRAWNDLDQDTRGWAIIDCMFNLSLLYWASEESGDPRFRNIAMRHADRVMDSFIRKDGSVCHIVEFSPETGKRIKSHKGQGYGHGSAWTRGQGWAVYGFMISYRHTGKEAYLEAAKKVASYCAAHIPDNRVIPVDFNQPKEPAWEDSCGACVIAGGLWEVASYMGEKEREYRELAVGILKAIDETRANWGTDCDAVVQNCTAAYHDKKHHMTMCYADYFFIEAVYKIRGTGGWMW